MKWLRSKKLFPVACMLSSVVGLLNPPATLADSFTWQSVNGGDFVTPAKDQGGMGSCWAFGAIGTLEANYKLTRNDPTFNIDLSEQNLICDVYQAVPQVTLPFTTGICTEAELPYTATTYSPNYPLQSGWQNRVVVSTTELAGLPGDLTSMKAELKTYGPLDTTICASDMGSKTLGTGGADHAVLSVGYVDNAAWAGGGYFIIKNSWGTGFGDNGFCEVAYANVTRFGAIQGLTGVSYYTGTMYFSGTDYTNPANYQTGTAACATWTGSNNTTWDTNTANNWAINGAAFTWVNQEVAATFDNTGSNRAITINGTAIAHALTVSGTGYSLSGGSLTVTAGGITANNSFVINAPVTVGAPQTWLTAAGQTLTINGNVNTVISTLTVNGAGNTYISGAIDGGGAINSMGAAAGNLVKNGAGTLSICGPSNYSSAITINAGILNLAPGSGATASYGGTLSGGGSLTVGGLGTVVLSGTNAFTGMTQVNSGLLDFTSTLALPSNTGSITINLGGAVLVGGAYTTISGWLGSNDITTASAGALALTGSSSETITMSGYASLSLGASGAALYNGALTSAGTTYRLGGGGGTLTFASALTGSNSLAVTGPGTVVLTKSNTYSGGTTISSGALQLGDGASNNGSAAGNITDNFGATLIFANPNAQSFSGAISGSGVLTKLGAGTLTLTGSNTYSGLTTINAGNLAVNGSLPAGGSVNVNATGTLSGTGSAGVVTVAAAGTLSPGVSGGTLSVASVNLNAGSDLAYTLGSGTNSRLAITGGLTIPLNVISNITPGSSWANGTYVLATYGGAATNNSNGFTGWVVRGTGLGSHIYSFTLGSGSLNMVVAAANAYAGSWTATTGGSWGSSGNWLNGHIPTNLTDTATFGAAIGSGAATITLDANRTLSGLTFSSTGNGNYTITAGTGGILTLDNGGSGAVPVSVTSGSDTISAAVDLADSLNFSGSAGTRLTISGSIGEWVPGRTLSVSGAGTLILAGSDAYTGATTVNGGTLQIGADGVTGSIDGTTGVTDNGTLAFNRSGTYTFGPAVSGSGNVAMLGPGTLVLTGSDTYTGVTTISGGTLQIGNGGGAGSINNTSGVSDNGALAFNRSDAYTFSRAISGSGAVLQLGSGTLALAVSNSYTGATIINSGVLSISNDNNLGAAPASATANQLVIQGGATLQTSGAVTLAANRGIGLGSGASIIVTSSTDTLTYAGVIANVSTGTAGSLTLGGAGTLTLTGSNTYTGVTTVGGGMLQLGDGTSKNGSVAGGIVVNTGSLTFANPTAQTFANSLTGSGNLTKIGAGEMTLSGTGIQCNGNVSVTSGTLQVVNAWSGGPGATPQTQYGFSAGAGLLLTANTLSIGPGTVLEFYVDDSDPYQGDDDGGWGDGTFASVTGASPLSHGSLGAQGGTIVTGNGVFRKTGSGVLAFECYNSSISFQMTGGTIDIEDGLLRNGAWGGPDWTNNLASMNIGPSGWFDMWRGNPVYIDALTGSGQFNDDDGYGVNNYLTIGVNNGSGTWSGQISDQSNTIFVIKTGNGTETFAGVNVYHGTTTISGGVLELANANAVENSTVVVNVNNGLTLATSSTYNVGGLSGSGNISLTAVNGSAATLSVGGNDQSTTYSGVLAGLGSLAKAGTGVLVLSASNTYTGSTTISAGTLQIGAGGATGSINSTSAVTDNGVLAFNLSGSSTFSKVISGSGNVSTLGPGTLILTASNTYSGGTTVGGGTLQVGNAAALGSTSGAATISSGVLDLHGFSLGVGGLSGAGDHRQPFRIQHLYADRRQRQRQRHVLGSDPEHDRRHRPVEDGHGDARPQRRRGVHRRHHDQRRHAPIGRRHKQQRLRCRQYRRQCLPDICQPQRPDLHRHDQRQRQRDHARPRHAGPHGLRHLHRLHHDQRRQFGGQRLAQLQQQRDRRQPGALSGSGKVGSVIVNSLGTVAPGFGGGGTLTASSLSLAASSLLSYTLGSGTATDSRLGITGGLTLNPGLTLTVTPGSSWVNGTYVLATYGSLTNNSSSFSGWTVGGSSPLVGRHTYGFSVSGSSLDLTVGSAAVVNGTWSGPGGGSWGTAGDWQGGNIPGYVGDTATFGTGIGSTAATVTLDGARGLSGLTLSTTGGGSYTLSRSGGDTASTLILANGGSTVPVSVSGSSQTIAVPVTFFDNVSVSVNSGASLTVSGAVGDGGAGKSLTVSGAGTLILAGSNTYGGGTTLSAGQLNINNASALGTGPLTISGGTIGNTSGAAITLSTNNAQTWGGDFTFAGANNLNLGTGAVTMSSSRTVTVASGNLTVGGVISGSGYSLTKAGTGTLTLGGADTYSGGTTVAAGVLAVNGSLGASGNMYVQAMASLAGTGSVGNVTVSSSGTVAPGSGGTGGTLTAASLTLATGDILAYTLGTGTGNDSLLAVSGGLTLSSSITLNVTPGAAWSNGSYVLATFGSLTDNSSSFSGWTVAGTGLGKHEYSFAISGGSLDLTVAPVSWIAPGGGSWANSTNWQGGSIPTTQGDTAGFGTSIGSSTATVTLDGARTLSGLLFNTTGGGSYIIASTDGSTLTLANYGSPAPVTVSGGNHTISAPMTLNDNLNFSANPGAGLTISGSVSGAGAVTVGGSGTLTITGTNNTYAGGTTVNSGTLYVTAGSSDGNSANISNVGLGMVTVNAGGTLIGQAEALGFGYNTIAAPLTINGGLVIAAAGTGTTWCDSLFCADLTMTGGTIGGDYFAFNGPVTIKASLTPSIISATNFQICNTNGRASYVDVASGATLVVSNNFYDVAATGQLTKNGEGTMILNGPAWWGSTTTINGGTLVVNNSLSSSAMTVAPAATLSGSGNITTSVDSSGTITPGYGSGSTLTVSSATLEPSSFLNYSLGTGSNSFLAIGGSLALSSSVTLNITPGASWGAGTYPLASFSSLADNSSGFTGWTVTGTGLGGHGYAFAISGGSLDLTVLPATAVAWNLATGGSWNVAGNWNPAIIPNTWYYTATFGNTIGSTTATVTLDSSPTVSGLTFSNTGTSSYILARSDTTSTLTLDNGVAPVALSNTTASNTIAVPVVLNSNLVISGTTGKTLTISGPVSGAAAMSFSGGSLVLSGSNTYTGGTTLSAGQLNINNASALGTGPFSLSAGTIGNTTGAAITVSTNNAENWNGDFTFAGANDLNLGTGNVTLGANRTVTVTSNNLTVGGVISGSGYSLTKAGAGTLTLGGSNTYSGGTTLSAGQLNINNAHALGSGTFTISGGTIGNTSGAAITLSTNNAENWNGNFTFAGTNDLNLGTGAVTMSSSRTVTVASNNLTVRGAISGSGYSLTKAGAGTLTLGGANSYSGGTTLSAGQLNLNNAAALGTGALTISTGTIGNTSGAAITLSTNNAQTWSGNFTFAGANDLNLGTGAVTMNASRTVTVASNNLTVGGAISGSGYSLTKAGTGTLTLGGANTYSGGTTLSAGQLNLNNAAALGTGALTISGGTIGNTSGAAITLSTNNAQTWSGNFTFAGANNLNLGTGAVAMSSSRTVTVASNNLTVGGVISGSGYSLTKAGAGALILSGSDTYTGGTTISAGTLQIGAGGATGSINGTSAVTDNGVLAFNLSGSSTFSKVVSGSGNVSALGPGTLILSASDTYSGGTTVGGGTLQLGNAAALGSTSGAAAVSSGATLDLHGYSLGVGALSARGRSTTSPEPAPIR